MKIRFTTQLINIRTPENEHQLQKGAAPKKIKLQNRKVRKARDPFYTTPESKSSVDFYNEKAFLSKNIKTEDVTDEDGKITLSTNEREVADQVLDLVVRGFPVSFATQSTYGIDLSNHNRRDVSEALARKIYDRFPVLEPTDKVKASLETFSTKSKKVMHYNPKTGILTIKPRNIIQKNYQREIILFIAIVQK